MRQQVQERNSDVPFPSNTLQLLLREPKAFSSQKGKIIPRASSWSAPGLPFQPLVSAILFFRSPPSSCDHRKGLEQRWTSKLKASPSGSIPSLPQQTGAVPPNSSIHLSVQPAITREQDTQMLKLLRLRQGLILNLERALFSGCKT